VELYKVGFPSLLSENEQTYFRYLEGVVSSIDESSVGQVTRRVEGISVRICPASPGALAMILQEIKRLHTMLGIEVEFSKSMRAGRNIFFNINFQNQENGQGNSTKSEAQ
jgi:hypothetical protein